MQSITFVFASVRIAMVAVSCLALQPIATLPEVCAQPRQLAMQNCCVYCRKGKACGNSCISRYKQCYKGPGCACDARTKSPRELAALPF